MITKITITGASGILGRSVFDKFCKDSNFITSGLVYSRASDSKKIKCDLTDDDAVFSTLNSIKPNLIIHCAAERRPDIVANNPNQAEKLNIGSTLTILKWASENHAKVFYISSDYVFDGSKPPYSEEDTPNPLNDYGLMKLKSEQAVISHPGNVILRLPILYGNVEYIEECAVSILFKKVQDHSDTAPMSNFEKRFPTHCDDVAETIYKMVTLWCENHEKLVGIFHYQSGEEMTKLDMAMHMAKLFNLPSDHIIAEDPPTGNETTKRPFKSELKCDKLKKLGLYHQPRTFDEGILESLRPFLI